MESTGGQTAADRCRARTEEGDRCSRPAGDDGFCYQHDADDPTVATGEGSSGDAEGTDPGTATADGGSAAESSAESAVEPADEADSPEESAPSDGSDEPAAESGDSDESAAENGGPANESPDGGDVPDILAVRRAVQDAAEGVIGRPLDGVLEVSPDDEGGWRVEVEVVERAAVPDTQDILGRYEIEVDDDARVRGYRRLERYRRGDTSQSQPT